jgi:hypothetical protein
MKQKIWEHMDMEKQQESEMPGSHGDEYDVGCLLGCCDV